MNSKRKNMIIKIVFPALFLLAIWGCDNTTDNPTVNDLTLVSHSILNITEPSDLALSYDKKSLWTVSDNTGNIYQLDLNGSRIKELQINGNDPEGITVINDQVLLVVFEKKNEVAFYDTSGRKLKSEGLDLEEGFVVGLEGITYNKNTGRYYVVNEKEPMAVLELDDNFNQIDSKVLTFSSDLSGIFYEENEDVYWIISHESKLVGKFDKYFNLLKSYPVPLQQGEGVAIDQVNKLIYLVSDEDNGFYVYRIEN